MTCDRCLTELDAYLDKTSTPQAMAELEDHLRTCTVCAAEAFRRMQLKQATRAAAAHFTPSAEFRARMQASLRKPERAQRRWSFSWMWPLAIAAACLVFIAASLPIFLSGRQQDRDQAELLDLHIATTGSPNPVDVVSTDRHTVKPWFQGKLPFAFNLPEESGTAYHLEGGKLIYLDHRPGAELLYMKGKHQLSVFLLEDDGKGSLFEPQSYGLHGFSVESWRQNGLRYTVLSDAGAGDVHALAEMFHAAGHS